jgi:hypothetical protein
MNSIRVRMFPIIAAACLLVAVMPARAQSDPVAASAIPDRSYQLLSEDENWSFLRDPNLREDFWDPIKYIPLRNRANDWYLTIGGETREVWEQIGNDNWGERHSGTVISMKDIWLTSTFTMANTCARSSS